MPFDPDEQSHFRPADRRTQQELGGILERAFGREGGAEPNEEEIRRLHALADEALALAETRLTLAREAEAAGESPEACELYRREARELREQAEMLRGRIA